MAQSKDKYPRQIITIEKINGTSEGYQVITLVSNELEEKAVEAAISYMNAFNEVDVSKTDSFI